MFALNRFVTETFITMLRVQYKNLELFFLKKFGWYCFPFAAVLMMCNVVRPISIFFLRKIYTGNSMIAVNVSVGISMCEVGLKVSYVCLVAES